jgi:hypothetical protein
MKTLASFIVVVMLAAPLAGCFVRSDRHHHHNNQPSARRGKGCGPAHHWNGYKCVHNGRGRR